MPKHKNEIINRELSWLSFNDRVLQEAMDSSVPIIERLRFLGIFSNNLDEFFRVRVATTRRMALMGKRARSILHTDPDELLKVITKKTLKLQKKFEKVYANIIQEIEKEHIKIINENELDEGQLAFVKNYFQLEVQSQLVPVMFGKKGKMPTLRDKGIYLSIKLYNKKEKDQPSYALIEIPTDRLSRFLVLPKKDNMNYIILLDDVIRSSLHEVFRLFQFDKIEAYAFKITRDAELDFTEDVNESMMKKLERSVQNRKIAEAVRFVYDAKMPQDLLDFVLRGNKIKKIDSIIPGGRYHNFKDFINFPNIGASNLMFRKISSFPHPAGVNKVSLLSEIFKKDILLYYPYHSFDFVIDVLRESAIDPDVVSIKINIYRVANNSKIINALINAARNGKSVTAVIELQARFDEERNIHWSNILQEEGVRVISGVPGLKVHSKLILIKKKVRGGYKYISHIGTGNFHEGTAKLYTDASLFTANRNICAEVQKIFTFVKDNYRRTTYRSLFVSPTNTRRNFINLIDYEITQAKKEKQAYIYVKLNNLTDDELIKKLYEASQAGVIIKMIIRGICTLIPGVKGMSENIEVISIVDRFLEHSRLFIFCHSGKEKTYLSSADWMNRNLDRRLEVTAPILDADIKNDILEIFKIQFADNMKSRNIDREGVNAYVTSNKKEVRSQISLYKYFKKKATDQEDES